ncbi:MAG: hypothetical protein U1E89_01345 [Burkholderiaceae bacterium]
MNAHAPAAAPAPERPSVPVAGRVPLLVLGFAGLVTATAAGLARLGWPFASAAGGWAGVHAPLMLCGFFGVVIALERAVALGSRWAFGVPLAAGLGSAALLLGHADAAGVLYAAAALGMLAASLAIVRRQNAVFTWTIALGAACWAVGSVLWATEPATGRATALAVPWWLGFLVLTIAGERLDLSRLLPRSRHAMAAFVALTAVVLAGLVLSAGAVGTRVFGIGLAGLGVWLLLNDVARRTVRQRGLTRYIAVCLLAGHGWLLVAGAVFAAHASIAPGQPAHDAVLHALGLGNVFSMVMGHAPVIVPAVLRVTIPYRAIFYGPLALLHGSLLLRVAGDALGDAALVRWGGAGNALALALFIVTTAAVAVLVRPRR